MSQTAWRIASEAKTFSANDLSGIGGLHTEGRWHSKGTPIVYAASTRALACLETLVHLASGGLPLNRFLVEVTIPAEIWTTAEKLTAASAPGGWDAEPAGRVSIQFGTDWLHAGRSAILIVPSAIVPEEDNVLINPNHPAASQITAATARKWLYDPRLVKRSATGGT